MKKNLLLCLLLSVALPAAVYAQTDEVAIRKTIDALWPSFEKHDLTTFGSFFKNSPDLYYQVNTPDNRLIVAHGWENMKKMIGGYFQNTPIAAQPATFSATESRIRVAGNTAVVTENIDVNGQKSLHLVTLEKMAGVWKITAFMGESYVADKLIVVK